jgi:adenylate cyclase
MRSGQASLHSAMRELYPLARSEIQRYGGTLRQVTGDRFTAVFGVPMAQEDHVQRAVLAALGLQRRLGERSGALGGVAKALTVRLGIHTGAVVVGGIGDDAELAAPLVGDTALLAAAFQDMAAPGMILCSEAVARLAQDIVRCEAMPPRSGQRAIMPAYKVLGLRPRRMSRGHRESQPTP